MRSFKIRMLLLLFLSFPSVEFMAEAIENVDNVNEHSLRGDGNKPRGSADVAALLIMEHSE